MFLTTKWSVKVDESARTIRSVKQNRHEYYERNMSTSAILDFPNVALYIVKWNVLFGCADTSLPSQENPTIWRYCIMHFFNYLFFLMAPNFLALATTLENLGATRLLAKKLISCTDNCFCVINKRLKVRKSLFGPVFALLQNGLIKIMQIESVYLQRLT